MKSEALTEQKNLIYRTKFELGFVDKKILSICVLW